MVRRTDEKEKGVWRSLDWWTILIYMALLAFGWISICGASYDFDMEGNIFSFDSRSGMQIVWIGTSLALGFILLMLDGKLYDTFAYVIYALLLVLLFVTPFWHETSRIPFVDKDRAFQPAVCRVCQMCHGIGFGQIHVCLRV